MQAGMFILAVDSCGSRNRERSAGGVADVLVHECSASQRGFIFPESAWVKFLICCSTVYQAFV